MKTVKKDIIDLLQCYKKQYHVSCLKTQSGETALIISEKPIQSVLGFMNVTIKNINYK